MYANKKTVVLIVGATGPIGSGVAKEFAKVLSKDSHIIVTSRSVERLNSLKKSLEQINPEITVRGLQWALDKPNIEQFRNDLKAPPCKFENAIIVHLAFEMGNLSHSILDIGANLPYLQVNLFYLLLDLKKSLGKSQYKCFVNSSYNIGIMELFGQASHKIVVDVTAASANFGIASFGYNCISKAARKMAFDILAKERNDIKVLYFQPGLVYKPGFHKIIEQTFNPHMKAYFQKAADDKETMCLSGDHVGRVLVSYIDKDEFESGKFVNATKDNTPEDIDDSIRRVRTSIQ